MKIALILLTALSMPAFAEVAIKGKKSETHIPWSKTVPGKETFRKNSDQFFIVKPRSITGYAMVETITADPSLLKLDGLTVDTPFTYNSDEVPHVCEVSAAGDEGDSVNYTQVTTLIKPSDNTWATVTRTACMDAVLPDSKPDNVILATVPFLNHNKSECYLYSPVIGENVMIKCMENPIVGTHVIPTKHAQVVGSIWVSGDDLANVLRMWPGLSLESSVEYSGTGTGSSGYLTIQSNNLYVSDNWSQSISLTLDNQGDYYINYSVVIIDAVEL